MESYRLIPEKYRFLNNSVLKCIALITMIIDHVASVLLHSDQTVLIDVFGLQLTLYALMRGIGRIAFPIYVFLLVEGFHHTHNRKAYGTRLLVFALISEIPWDLEHSGSFFFWKQNVFFTLFLGYLGLCLIERLKKEDNRFKNTLLLLTVFLISVFLRADYGFAGFGFILLFGLFRNYPVYRAIAGTCFLSETWQAGFAFIPIAFYNGKRGFVKNRFLKILFYVLYPLHMLVLFFIKKYVFGGY
ncbi:MAG: TraX protein [Clostridia bacterium]|nr:TraX protein [Clostridia bacterium]